MRKTRVMTSDGLYSRSSRNLQAFPYSTADLMQMSAQSVQHTATDPAGYHAVTIIIIAVPL